MVVAKENIEASGEEYEKETERMAEVYQMEAEKVLGFNHSIWYFHIRIKNDRINYCIFLLVLCIFLFPASCSARLRFPGSLSPFFNVPFRICSARLS